MKKFIGGRSPYGKMERGGRISRDAGTRRLKFGGIAQGSEIRRT